MLPTIKRLDITDTILLQKCIKDIKREKPSVCSFDTETNGLNIKFHKPFLMTFGFLTLDSSTIYTYSIDYEKAPRQLSIDTVYVLNKLIELSQICVGHNITFDFHMQDNIGLPILYKEKCSDTQIYIRLGRDPLKEEEGGPPMALKKYATRYITPTAKSFESKLTAEMKAKRLTATHELKAMLKDVHVYDKYRVTGTERRWTKKMIDTFFGDKINDLMDLPPDVRTVVQEWMEKTEDPENYQNLNRENVTLYAHYDIYYTLNTFLIERVNVVDREQEDALKIEQEAIVPIYILEKTGAYLDLNYVQSSKNRMKIYIKELRNELYVLLQQKITIGQHEELKKSVKKIFNIDLPNTQKSTLKEYQTKDIPEKLKRVFIIISELRSLEKWYSTYIVKWLNEATLFDTNVVYPTYHQTGTVTGRVSSPFQQFPKGAKYTIDGELLFHPRRMFIAPENKIIVFFDYAAMEMRIQANYTMLIDEPDITLCRAFIPLHCFRYDEMHNMIDYATGDDIDAHVWYLNEDPKQKWIPTDVHEATAFEAFGLRKIDPGGKEARNKGKTGNFAIIYGATANTLETQLGLSKDDAQRVYKGFQKAFPKIRNYGDYVQGSLIQYGYAQNLLGRKYYNISAHKGKNYLIQGTGADYTKTLLPKLIELLEPYETKIQGYLHDEFSFLMIEEELFLIPLIKEIMEELETPITLRVDVESTRTSWDEKRDYILPS